MSPSTARTAAQCLSAAGIRFTINEFAQLSSLEHRQSLGLDPGSDGTGFALPSAVLSATVDGL